MDYLTEIFILAMLAIIYLQSGIDKIVDWKGNLQFMGGHFAKTPFKNMVPVLLLSVTIMEVLAGVASVLGIVMLLVSGAKGFAMVAVILSLINFLSLLLGQRLAKDYGGAQTIVIHLVPTFFLLYLLLGK